MITSLLLLSLGIAALIIGGSALVDGAARLALRLGIAPIVIGLTVVAFGTSTPELIVNLMAATRGSTEIGFGNVIGSNIANIGLLLAVSAVVAPLAIHRTIVTREIPMMILASLSALVLGSDAFLGDGPAGYGRGEGLMLLLLFCVFLYYTVADALRHRTDPSIPDVRSETGERRLPPALAILAGLLALVVGGELTVRGAVLIAEGLDVPETTIALTIVAFGTSLPELATSLTAARKGQGDIAIGNIVGSNIYNLLFIWGLTTTIAPSALPANGGSDLLFMCGFALVLLPFVRSQGILSRREGAAMILGYALYVWTLLARVTVP